MRQIFRPAPWEAGWQVPRDPFTAALAAMGIASVGSAISMKMQGDAAAQNAGWNKQIYEQQANQAIAEARARADIQARGAARSLGATRAAYGAAGVDVNQGTPLEVMSDQATEAELQHQLLLYQGNVQAFNLRQRGDLVMRQGFAAQQGAEIAAGLTLLTGAANIGAKAYSGNVPAGAGKVPSS